MNKNIICKKYSQIYSNIKMATLSTTHTWKKVTILIYSVLPLAFQAGTAENVSLKQVSHFLD